MVEFPGAHDWLYFERACWNQGMVHVAGIDEAGRGPLAGPVVAAAVIFSPACQVMPGIDDSKKLSALQRERLCERIMQDALSVGIAEASAQEIDDINILQATYLAMRRAVAALAVEPAHLLVDGRGTPGLAIPASPLIRGDGRSMSIAAASIIAKVTRDRIMAENARLFPEYGFLAHKGYPTPQHIEAIRRHGLSPLHRRSFHPKALEPAG